MEPDIRGKPHCIYCTSLIDPLNGYCDLCKKVLTRGEIIYYPAKDEVPQTKNEAVTASPESRYQVQRIPCSSCGTLIDRHYHLCPHCRQHTRPYPDQPGRTVCDTSSRLLQGPPLEYQSCRKKHTGGKVLIVLGALFLLVIAAGVCVSTPSSGSAAGTGSLTVDQVRSAAMIIPYDDLVRNNEQYIGKTVKIRGKIIQSQSSGNEYAFSVATRPDYYNLDIVYLNYNGPRFIEGDLVDIWGRVDGLKSNPTVLGNSVMIPEFTSNHLELVPQATLKGG